MNVVKSLTELQEAAKPLFEKMGVNKLYATTDEQFFILESRARLHAGKNLTVYPINSDEVMGASTEENTVVGNVLSVKEISQKIADETSLQVLNDMLLEEVGGSNRKSAVAAIEKRIAFLNDLRKEGNNE